MSIEIRDTEMKRMRLVKPQQQQQRVELAATVNENATPKMLINEMKENFAIEMQQRRKCMNA